MHGQPSSPVFQIGRRDPKYPFVCDFWLDRDRKAHFTILRVCRQLREEMLSAIVSKVPLSVMYRHSVLTIERHTDFMGHLYREHIPHWYAAGVQRMYGFVGNPAAAVGLRQLPSLKTVFLRREGPVDLRDITGYSKWTRDQVEVPAVMEGVKHRAFELLQTELSNIVERVLARSFKVVLSLIFGEFKVKVPDRARHRYNVGDFIEIPGHTLVRIP